MDRIGGNSRGKANLKRWALSRMLKEITSYGYVWLEGRCVIGGQTLRQ